MTETPDTALATHTEGQCIVCGGYGVRNQMTTELRFELRKCNECDGTGKGKSDD